MQKKFILKEIFLYILVFFVLVGLAFFVRRTYFSVSPQPLEHEASEMAYDPFIRRLYLVETHFDSFKEQVTKQTGGEIKFCDNTLGQNSWDTSFYGLQVAYLSEDTAIVKFPYCKDILNLPSSSAAVVKFNTDDSFMVIKILDDIYNSPSWEYGEWQKLQREYGPADFVPRNFIKKSAADFFEVKVENELDNGWAEVYWNPFVLGLNQEKPDTDNYIYFGLHEGKPVLFFTNEYIRYRNKLSPNQGLAAGFDGEQYFVDFKSLTNQSFLRGNELSNPYFDIQVSAVSEASYHYSAPFILVNKSGFFVVVSEVTTDLLTQRDIGSAAVEITSQPEMTNKIIDDFKKYLSEVGRS